MVKMAVFGRSKWPKLISRKNLNGRIILKFPHCEFPNRLRKVSDLFLWCHILVANFSCRLFAHFPIVCTLVAKQKNKEGNHAESMWLQKCNLTFINFQQKIKPTYGLDANVDRELGSRRGFLQKRVLWRTVGRRLGKIRWRKKWVGSKKDLASCQIHSGRIFVSRGGSQILTCPAKLGWICQTCSKCLLFTFSVANFILQTWAA